MECEKERASKFVACIPSFLDCNSAEQPDRQYWLNVTNLRANCNASNENLPFKFGMFSEAFTEEIASASFIEKFLWCLWWGLRQLR